MPNSRDDLQSRVINGTRVSTLVIVIATACSVLGVLLLIMVVVVFRRKKPRPRLFHPSVTPPPYSRVHNSVLDEHDRLALMAYADATRVHLPTYEEAVQGRGGHASSRGGNSLPVGDYRPLPSIPPNLRAPGTVPGGGADNPNRHSTVTTSTMNRDGLSENFGSLDTVNVSMSDASTSVTVETFDSGTSNRSMSSQRATAGSIASSEDNLANDSKLIFFFFNICVCFPSSVWRLVCHSTLRELNTPCTSHSYLHGKLDGKKMCAFALSNRSLNSNK